LQALSKGNRQKAGLVQAFMHAPDLLVLDEPTAGLDPLVQHVVHDLLTEAKADGATVFLSSHVLPEVQQVADRVALIRDGRLVLVSGVDELRTRAVSHVEATFAALPPPATFARIPGVRETGRHGHTISFALQGEADPLVKALARHRVIAVDSHEADLEDIFLSLYRHEEARDAA
jgi:ABC-2 type transport system ATP-binding protein